MTTEKQVLSALEAVRTTGNPQSIGTFTFSLLTGFSGTGVSSHQTIHLIDTTAPGRPIVETSRIGGVRYWPTTASGMKRLAKSFASQDAKEMQSRLNLH